MASYQVRIRRSAEKDLRKLTPTTTRRVWAKIRSLRREPLPSASERLAGSTNEYRLRVGAYRILYEVDREGESVDVFRIAHRREAYRKR